MRPGGGNGATVSVESQPHRLPASFTEAMRRTHDEIHAEHAVDHVIPDTEFDELVVGRWLHIEQMDVGRWWMTVGGVVLHVDADRDGRPRQVSVHTAGTWDPPVEGCRYVVDEEEEQP